MNKFCLVFFVIVYVNSYAQNEIKVRGLITASNASVEGVHVLNLVSEKSTVSNANGEFFIEVKEDDLLVFSAIHLNYWRKSISAQDVKNGVIEVVMTPKVNELEEVVVTENTKITAQSLGIINYKPVAYTPAERRIRTATTGLLDPLLNWMSGRTKQLKKDLQIEKREKLIIRLESYFEDVYLMQTFKIPEEYVDGFKFYVVEDIDLAEALNAKNKIRATFLLGELSQEFLNYLDSNEK